MRLLFLVPLGMAFLGVPLRAQDFPRSSEPQQPVPQGEELHAPRERRLWEDEIVYVIVIQKFCNGDRQNDVPRSSQRGP
jgi:hypothetical protein